MRFLLFLVVVAAVAAVIVWALKRAREAREAAKPPPPRTDPLAADPGHADPRELKVGDVVGFEGREFLVRGTLRLDQAGFRWQEHLLDDTRTRRWLSVEDDEGLELCLWERLPAAAQSAALAPLEPGPATVTHDGTEYRLTERGEATFSSDGTTGTAPAGRMEYVDYSTGERRLSFERFGTESWEVGIGRVVAERELTIYPVTD